MSTREHQADATGLAQLLKKIKLPDYLRIGRFLLPGSTGVTDRIQYNQGGLDLLENKHEYTFPLLDGELQVEVVG